MTSKITAPILVYADIRKICTNRVDKLRKPVYDTSR